MTSETVCEFCGEPVQSGEWASLGVPYAWEEVEHVYAHMQCANRELGFDESIRYARWDTREVW